MGIPYVIEVDEKDREKSYDLYSRLLKDRIIFLRGAFVEQMASAIVAQLLFLETVDKEKDIYMYINSEGGEMNSMYAIFDTMNYISPDIITVGVGQIMSAGSFILAAGKKGSRCALPNSSIMIHELSFGAQGKFNEVDNLHRLSKRSYEKMAKYYSEFTGQIVNKVKKDMKKDYYMTAEEAVDYGLIDYVLDKRG